MIEPLSVAEPASVEALLDAAFGTDRHKRTAYRMREGCAPIAELSFSAWDDGRLIGTLQSWPVVWVAADVNGNERRVPLVMVGPVAVLPALQRGGTGRALMDALIAAADRPPDTSGAGAALMMIGDPEYYSRFWGFSADATGAWELPGPVERHRLLARAVRDARAPSGAGILLADPER